MHERRLSNGEIEETLRPLIGRDIEHYVGGFYYRGPFKRFQFNNVKDGNQIWSFFADWVAFRKDESEEWRLLLEPMTDDELNEGFLVSVIDRQSLSIKKQSDGSFYIPIAYLGPITFYPEGNSLTTTGKIQL